MGADRRPTNRVFVEIHNVSFDAVDLRMCPMRRLVPHAIQIETEQRASTMINEKFAVASTSGELGRVFRSRWVLLRLLINLDRLSATDGSLSELQSMVVEDR